MEQLSNKKKEQHKKELLDIIIKELKLASYNRLAKRFGGSCHITLPKNSEGKSVIAIVLE